MNDSENRRRAILVGVLIAIVLVILLAAVALGALLSDDDEENDGETADNPTSWTTAEMEVDQTISVIDPWVRATIGPMATEEAGDMEAMSGLISAAFMTLENHSDQADRLIGVQTDVATVVEIHETTMENDVMQMRPVEGVEIPANGSAELAPGGLHIMLMDVQRELQPGEVVTLTLTFESGLELIVEASVRRLE